MKLLIPVLLVVLAVTGGFAQSSSTDAPSSTPAAPDGSTSPAVDGSSTTGNPASQATGGSAATGGSSDSTVAVSTQAPTTAPLLLTTFPISNDLTPQDAKLILQQALQLDQQIKDLNQYLISAKADTDVNSSPLFAQLTAFSANITAQNATLQGYITQLQTLSTTQASIDSRVASATSTFTCFSESSCVTLTPTTAAPTSPGPAPSVTPCTNSKLTANLTAQSYNQAQIQNAAQCSVSVVPTTSTNNVSVLIDIAIGGPDAFVTLVETRTNRAVNFTTSTTGYNFTAFQQIDVFYYSGERSTVQFNFTYVEVNTCTRNCNSGTCMVSQSGVQYCQCPKCQFTGDNCETALPDPCQSKQKRICGQNNQKADGTPDPYGTCYKTACADQCYACACSPELVDPDNAQTCKKPDADQNFSPPITPPTDPTVCPTTAAPTTTAALFTSTIAPSTIGGSTGVPASPGTDGSSTTGAAGSPSTTIGGGGDATSTGAVETSSVASTTSVGPDDGTF